MVHLQQRQRRQQQKYVHCLEVLPTMILYGGTIVLVLSRIQTKQQQVSGGGAWYCFGYSDRSSSSGSSSSNVWGGVDGFTINPTFTSSTSSLSSLSTSPGSTVSGSLLKPSSLPTATSLSSSSSTSPLSLLSTTNDSTTSSVDVVATASTEKNGRTSSSDVPIIVSNKITKHTWMYQSKYPIAYETMRLSNDDNNNEQSTTPTTEKETTPILFLNGFGMGSFHQHRLMKSFAKQYYSTTTNNDSKQQSDEQQQSSSTTTTSTDYMLYGIDYIGQGFSWPMDCNDDGTSKSEIGLQYSGNQWVEQIIQFIEECIVVDNQIPTGENDNNNNNDTKQQQQQQQRRSKNKVHIVGNSLGGHLAVYIAAKRPDLIDSIILLNPTPLWGMNLPGWDGVLPPPSIPRIIGRYLYDIIRHPVTIRAFLQATYVHPSSWDGNNDSTTENTDVEEVDKLSFTEKITKSTSGLGGHAAFASILWSRAVTIECNTNSEGERTKSLTINNFYDCLQHVQCNVLLCFGTQDPWCKPIFAKRMCNELSSRSLSSAAAAIAAATHTYIEIDNVGHCPNHEAPNTVAHILNQWFNHHHWNNNHDTTTAIAQLETRSTNEQGEYSPLLFDKCISITEEWGDAIVTEKSPDDISLSFIDQLMVKYI